MHDLLDSYKKGLELLLVRLGGNITDRATAELLQTRFLENINEEEKYGITDNLRSERARLVNTLNTITNQVAGMSFLKLCEESTKPPGPQETLVVREKYYVLLLIDSSESMLWPYLEDQTSKRGSPDWQEATKKVKAAISSAHDMAIISLRNSIICKERSLYIYQYLFNDRKIILNNPEELSPYETIPDKVVRINEEYYTPISTTALYDTIYEALVNVRDTFLRKAREDEKRIDRLIVGVITDGDDTVVKADQKERKIDQIREVIESIRNTGKQHASHLVKSVLIGLTSQDFTKDTLNRVKKELSFDDYISLDNSDHKSIRNAFKLWSSYAAQS
jgi:hypothetical protein